jgi:hypothetical protein
MHIVASENRFCEDRTELPEALNTTISGRSHASAFDEELHREENEAVREAEAEFGLYCENSIVFLLYRFGETLPWSDSAFSWWNVAEEDRRIPAPQMNPAGHILLKII